MLCPRGVVEHLLKMRNRTWCESWLNQRQTAQAGIQMLLSDAEASSIQAGNQTDFGSLIDEVLDQRCCLGDSAFKADAKIFLIDVVGQARIQHDSDPALVFSSELAHRQLARTRRSLPINVPQIVTRLVVPQQKQI